MCSVHLLTKVRGEGVDANAEPQRYASARLFPKGISVKSKRIPLHTILVVDGLHSQMMLCICVSLDAELDCNG
jgi:hypothetical protein